MVEKSNEANTLLKMGVFGMAILSVGTLSVGFTLCALDYISSQHFLIGIAAGVGAASTVFGIGGLFMRDRFFKPVIEDHIREKDHLINLVTGKMVIENYNSSDSLNLN
jgi:hypothetical protein